MRCVQKNRLSDSRSGRNNRCRNPACFWPIGQRYAIGALDVTAKPLTECVLSPGLSVQPVIEPGTARVMNGSIVACTWVVPLVAIQSPARATKTTKIPSGISIVLILSVAPPAFIFPFLSMTHRLSLGHLES